MSWHLTNKICVNRRHCFYFVLLMVAAAWLAMLHWVVNPYKLAIWINSSDSGYVVIESQCEGAGAITETNKQAVTAGYFQYELSLPKCRLSTIKIFGADRVGSHQEVSSIAVTYYGKEIYRLLGSKRTLEGEGIFDRDSRPSRAASVVLDSPLVLKAHGINTSDVLIWWPRYLPLFLLPFVWWFSRILTDRKALDPEKKGASNTIAFLAVVALSLITTMAVIARTDVSVHPDELTHVASARHYYDHWLKPKIGAPETLDAHKTNVYGVAYLTGIDPVYQLAGKFAVAVWPIFENDVVALRMFNVALFALLTFLALGTTNVRIAIIPLLATPQAWYIFSYFNGDGLPLFLSLLAMVAFLGLYKSKNHLIRSRSLQREAFIAGCLAGGILLSKPNYWPVLGVLALLFVAHGNYLTTIEFTLMSLGWLLTLFGMFFFLDNEIGLPGIVRLLPICIGLCLLLWAGVIFIQSIIRHHKTGLLRIELFAALLIGMTAVVGLKMIDETWQNPLPFTTKRSEAISKVREFAATSAFKPSAYENKSLYRNLRMRDQGISIGEMLSEKPWFQKSVASFLGVYGYMNIWSKYLLYALLCMFLIVVISVLMLSMRSLERGASHAVQLSLLVGVTTVVAASIGFSWTYAFQPQGRYLLAILPILSGGLLIADENVSRSKILQTAVVGAFLLSAASFLLVGIQEIAKQPGVY